MMHQSGILHIKKAPLTFRKWGRKGFSVFNSLHKVIRIGQLSSVYLLFAIPANAEYSQISAYPDTTRASKEVEVDEIVVNAQRAPVAFSQAARLIQVIDKKELETSPSQSLPDLLKFISGIDVRQRGNNGVQSDISIHGSSFDQVLILLNGIPINDPQTGHHNLNLPVSFDAIDRIEIVKGPAARLFGSNAFSGAINIITGENQSGFFKGLLSGGQFGFFESAGALSFHSGSINNSISVDYKRSDGALKNTDFNISDVYYHASADLKNQKLEFQGGYSDRSFGSNGFYTPVYPNQFEHTQTTFASLKSRFKGSFHMTPSIYWRANRDRFELFRNNIGAPSWYKSPNFHSSTTLGGNLNGWANTSFGKIALGVEFKRESILSNVLGTPLSTPVAIPHQDGLYYTNSDQRFNGSLFSEYSQKIGKVNLSGGLLLNWNSSLEKNWGVYPGLDAKWNFNDFSKLYLTVNKSFRLPTFTDLYYKSATNIGNPTLQPEDALSFETGINYQKSAFKASVGSFYRWGKNMIDWVRQPNETLWYAKNWTNLDTYGIDISAALIPSILYNRPTIVQSIDLSWGWMNQNKSSGLWISKYLLDYLKNKIDLRLRHSVYKNISASWNISYQVRNGTFTKWEGGKYGAEVEYAPVWLVNGRLDWTVKQLNIFWEASNLLNKRYFDYGNVEQPGIWMKTGLALKIQ